MAAIEASAFNTGAEWENAGAVTGAGWDAAPAGDDWAASAAVPAVATEWGTDAGKETQW